MDGQPLQVDTRKAVAILALLAGEGRTFARDELAALLWADSDDAAARGALRRTLSVLRSAIDADVLRIDRSRVALDPRSVRVDLEELERRSASGTRDDLVAASALARGPFLAGFTMRDSPEFDDWRATRAASVERTVLGVLDRLAAAQAKDGDFEGATATTSRRLELDPLDESAHVRLMELAAAAGDRAAALRQYRACVAILDRELGVAPLPDTTARYEAIRDVAPATPERSEVASPMVGAEIVSTRVAVDPNRTGRRPPIVAREAALTLIETARRAAVTDGRVVVLSGEAGIGKTRVASAAGEAARDVGATVLSIAAYATERTIAYGPITGLLRAAMADPAAAERLRGLSSATAAEIGRLVPGLARNTRPTPVGDPAAAQARLVAAITETVTTATVGPSPGLVIIDDLQWADEATLAVLAYIMRRLDGRAFAIVCTWRPEDLDAPTRAIAELARTAADGAFIELQRLDRASVAELVAAAPGGSVRQEQMDALWRASEGLPLYVAEALAGGSWTASSMPDGVRAILRRRLDGVDGVAAQVLATAAAIGRSFDLPTVRYASGRTEDEVVEALESLTDRGLIRETDVGGAAGVAYDFAHAGLRDLADEMTSLARRRLLHRRIAEALRLDLAGAGRDDLGRLVRIAQHEQTAGRDVEAAQAFREAGDGARRIFANREAAAHYETALGLGHPDVADLHVAIGDLRTRLGDYGGAIQAYQAAASRAAAAALPAVEAALARAHLRRGDLIAADRHLDASLAIVTDRVARARLLAERAVIRRRAGDLDVAALVAVEAVSAAIETGDTGAIGAAQRVAGLVALDRGESAVARARLSEALEAALSDPDPTAQIAASTGLALAAGLDGDVAAALAHGETAVAVCRRIGDRHLEAAVENHLADMLHAAGRDEDARVHLLRAVEAFAEVGGDPADPDPGIWMLSAS